jgi:hypothetical protein
VRPSERALVLVLQRPAQSAEGPHLGLGEGLEEGRFTGAQFGDAPGKVILSHEELSLYWAGFIWPRPSTSRGAGRLRQREMLAHKPLVAEIVSVKSLQWELHSQWAPADLELIAQLKSRLQCAEKRIRALEERLWLMRIEKYGAGGEKNFRRRKCNCSSLSPASSGPWRPQAGQHHADQVGSEADGPPIVEAAGGSHGRLVWVKLAGHHVASVTTEGTIVGTIQ